jgi:hypothetical protein
MKNSSEQYHCKKDLVRWELTVTSSGKLATIAAWKLWTLRSETGWWLKEQWLP